MVSKCSNPLCSALFLYLNRGKLFRFDQPDGRQAGGWGAPRSVQKVEFFWLCETCAKEFTLVTDAAVGARVVALQQRASAASAGP